MSKKLSGLHGVFSFTGAENTSTWSRNTLTRAEIEDARAGASCGPSTSASAGRSSKQWEARPPLILSPPSRRATKMHRQQRNTAHDPTKIEIHRGVGSDPGNRRFPKRLRGFDSFVYPTGVVVWTFSRAGATPGGA